MIRFIYLIVATPSLCIGQLQVEWKKEFDLPPNEMTRITGIFSIGEDLYCSASNLAVTKMQKITKGLGPIEVYTIPNYVWWYAVEGGQLWSRESNNMHMRDISNGNIIKSILYKVQDDWPATSPVSCFYKESLYYAQYSIICRFDKNGELVWKKQVSTQADNPLLMAQGKGYIYLFGQYTGVGSRLIQYDTLGSQKWNVGIGRIVGGMLADENGNCYMLTYETGGIGYVEKYDQEGKLILDVKLPGQRGVNAFKSGDSLFVCGEVSSTERIEGQKLAAFCIISATTGKVYQQQTIDLDPDPDHLEEFTQIVSDGKSIYAGGFYGGQTRTPFLIKYSHESTTALNDQTNLLNSINIFPNPSGSKFTITCSDQRFSPLKVTVRNITGQIVHKETLSCNDKKSYQLNLEKQPSGNYTVEIDNGNKKVVKKVVVE